MASDAGPQAPLFAPSPPGATSRQAIAIIDPLNGDTTFVYLFTQARGILLHRRERLRRLRPRPERRSMDRSFQLRSLRPGKARHQQYRLRTQPDRNGLRPAGRHPAQLVGSFRARRRHRQHRYLSVACDRTLDGPGSERGEARPAGRVRTRSARPLEGPRVPAGAGFHHLARRLRGRAGELGGERRPARRAHGSGARHPRDLGRGLRHQRHQDKRPSTAT